jgi:N-acetyl-anhydromuramyl-L-alanine amidase AmpD
VKESDTAWHAWKWNPQSIGIEVCAAPGQKGTPEQYESLAWLTKDIMTRHSIKRITGHRFLGIATKCPGMVFRSQEEIDDFLRLWDIRI